jgi:hypothetical protein
MGRPAWIFVICVACGSGDDAGSGGDETPAGNDAPLLDGAPPVDGTPPADAPPTTDRPNRVFVNNHPLMGDLGGLAGADQICATEAAAAGLPGTFVAFLSTSTVDARDRLAGSRGWVATDGKPVLDTIEGLIDDQRHFNPIVLDAAGQLSTPFYVMTGTDPQGRKVPGSMCADWTQVLPDLEVGTNTAAGARLISDGFWDCFNGGMIYCFETGNYYPVAPAPAPPNPRYGFISTTHRSAPGVPHLDAICTDEAIAAGLPGTYRAAVATSTSSIASRFTTDARDWTRPDGTIVAAGDELLTVRDYYRSFFNQHADGTYTDDWYATASGADPTANGIASRTCNDWQHMTSGGGHSVMFATASSERGMWGYIPFQPCNEPMRVLCLQE